MRGFFTFFVKRESDFIKRRLLLPSAKDLITSRLKQAAKYLPKEAVKWTLSLQDAHFVTIEVRIVSIDYNFEGKFHFGVV